ncbi:hypothetical protein [Clostridioides difficile]|uniref:hypothetical protein n=1 Tax=Clostridioides difficile TaxID=1496 RepID=UPI0018DB7B13|nr:hypothetical protein [Clostridioides difficile]
MEMRSSGPSLHYPEIPFERWYERVEEAKHTVGYECQRIGAVKLGKSALIIL